MCCGPCTIFPLKTLQQEGHDVQGYFFNPNIHPYKEFLKRLNTLREYLLAENVPLIERSDYNFEDYIRKIAFHEEERCLLCYEMRLRETAEIALKNNCDAFSTTLFVSPYQNHNTLKEIALKISKEKNIELVYRDFRSGFKEATALSREKAMYRQPYCGCIYSEKERYYKG
jgi:predicted adenine nucleotide alpha hydrolase (AANH) superfamily ATPase